MHLSHWKDTNLIKRIKDKKEETKNHPQSEIQNYQNENHKATSTKTKSHQTGLIKGWRWQRKKFNKLEDN